MYQVCMNVLDHWMNQQQQQPPGTNKIMMVNGDSKVYSPANDSNTVESLRDNGHHEYSEFKASTNNVSTYTITTPLVLMPPMNLLQPFIIVFY